MKDTFYLSNIVPQNYQNNSGFWNRFEMYCRDLTKVYANVYVLTGPLMMPYVDTDQKTYIKYEVRSAEALFPQYDNTILVT